MSDPGQTPRPRPARALRAPIDLDDASRARVLACIQGSERAAQRAACDEALRAVPRDAALRTALRELVRTGAPETRFAALWVLFRSDTPSLRWLAPLLDALELADGDLRWEALQMLVALGRLHGEVLAVLLHEVRAAGSPLRRRMTLYGLRELAPEREETERAFLQALDDPSPDVRRAALSSSPKLMELGPDWLPRTRAIAQSDADPRMRVIAPLVLARIAELDPQARESVEAELGALAASPDPDLQRSAQIALRRLAPRVP